MTTKMYAVKGMMCDGCVATVKTAIKGLPEVIAVQVQLDEPQAIISMREEIPEEALQEAVAAAGQYSLREIKDEQATDVNRPPEKKPNRIFGLFRHKKDCCK